MPFILERLISIFNLIAPNNISVLIVAFYISAIVLPIYFGLVIFTNDKHKKVLDFCTSALIILSISSVLDHEIVVTSKIKIIASLKFISFISLGISVITIYILVVLWNRKDINSLSIALIIISSIVAGFVSIKLNKQYYALGDYYENILYLPLNILELVFHTTALIMLKDRHSSASKVMLIASLVIIVFASLGLLVCERGVILGAINKMVLCIRCYYLLLAVITITKQNYNDIFELILLAINNNFINLPAILFFLKRGNNQDKILQVIKIIMIVTVSFSFISINPGLLLTLISNITILSNLYLIYLEYSARKEKSFANYTLI